MFVINICERPLFKESYTTPDGSCNNIYILFGKGKRKVMTVQNHSEHTGGGKNCRLNWPETRAPHPFERCKSPKRTCQNIQQTNENLKAQVLYIHIFLKFGHVPHTHTEYKQRHTRTNIDESSQSWSARSGSAPLLVSCLGWIFGFIVSRKSKGTLQCTPPGNQALFRDNLMVNNALFRRGRAALGRWPLTQSAWSTIPSTWGNLPQGQLWDPNLNTPFVDDICFLLRVAWQLGFPWWWD